MLYKQIIKFLNSQFPQAKAEEWDFVGSSYPKKNLDIKKILIALDLSSPVLEIATTENIDLIITHHPFIFDEDKEIHLKEFPYKQFIDQRLNDADIAVFSIHTNFDVKEMSKIIAKKMKVDYKKIPNSKYGFTFTWNKSVNALKAKLKKDFKLQSIKSSSLKNVLKKVAFFPGALSSEEVLNAKKAGTNLIIASDIKWSDQLFIKEEGMEIINISHNVENIFVDRIKELIANKYKDIEIMTYQEEEILKYD